MFKAAFATALLALAFGTAIAPSASADPTDCTYASVYVPTHGPVGTTYCPPGYRG